VTKWVTISKHAHGRRRTAAHQLTCVTAVFPQAGTRLKSARPEQAFISLVALRECACITGAPAATPAAEPAAVHPEFASTA